MQRWLARVVAVALVVSGVAVVNGGAALAAGGSTAVDWTPPEPEDVTPVPVEDRPAEVGDAWTADERTVKEPPTVTWPAAGEATADLSRGGSPNPPSPAFGDRVRAGSSPVWLANAAGSDLRDVEVAVASRPAVTAAGVDGMVFTLSAGTTSTGAATTGELEVGLDYRSFAEAYGGDWASRLRLVELPLCALSTPQDAACLKAEPVATDNDAARGVLSANVQMTSGATVLAVASAPSGESGDYTATSLSPAATWQVSPQTGDFSWSYPLRMPPSVGGSAPPVSLAYSSGSVDGRTSMTNSQGSWVGDGWDAWSGYIERRYVGCADDKAEVDDKAPNNATHPTGDQCWKTLNATVSLNGRAGELIQVGTSPVWRLENDDGTRFELLKDAARANGDDDGEYWKVTTPDGMQYFFGYNKLPGGAVTDSTWTVPVAGNHDGEPCHAATFAGSFCSQAWRWNLDYVVDPSGNTVTYHYGKETNGYGQDAKPGQRVGYVRGGWLSRIDYGMRAGAESNPAPLRVVFDVADRCTESCYSGTPATPNAPSWPDTPWDQDCAAAPCTNQLAPTFWTSKRLAAVTTKVQVSGTTYQDVESWTLRHVFLDAGEGEGKPMWLAGITRNGKVTRDGGPAVGDPEIVFDAGAEPMPNRVDGPADGRTALNRFRIKAITTESGGQILVTYSDPDCTRTTLPTPPTNTKRCMPQYYAPPGGAEPTLDWFHKYVVTRLDLVDGVGRSPTQTTFYDYLDAPAWHYADDELTKDKNRTWSEWRGYGKVRVRSGDANGEQTAVETHYLRGMHGDHLSPTSTRTVDVADTVFPGSIQDHEALQGFVREEITYDGFRDGAPGPVVSAVWHDPWKSGPTATRTRNGITTQAWKVQPAVTRTRTPLEAGGARVTRTVTGFNADGLPVTRDELGDEAVTGDERCTRTTYARNETTGMVDKVRQTETLSVSCAGAPDPAAPATVVSRTRTYFDDPDDLNAAPTRGLPVKTEELARFDGTTPVYDVADRSAHDAYGRITEAYDANGNKTTTAYTPATGPVTQTVVTNPMLQKVTTAKEPAWDLPTKVTDPNGLVTEMSYDGLGRVLGVWQPGRARSQSPSSRFAYDPHTGDAATAVTTQTLLPNGSAYKTSVNLYDGFLRLRQNQVQATGGGRLITDTAYDAAGRTAWESAPYYNDASGPNHTVVGATGTVEIPAVTRHRYDGAGRETEEIFEADGDEAWRTSTRYGGDRVHTTPPDGGVATTSLTDAYDQTVELRRYFDPHDQGSTDPADFERTSYTYDKAGRLATLTDPAGDRWTYTTDLRGRTTRAVDPDKGTNVSTYDKAGNLATSTDGRGVTVAYTYDALNRKTSLRDGSATGALRAEWVYDTLANGVGKLTRSTRWVDGNAYVSRVDGYDAAGRPTGTSLVLPSGATGEGGLCAAGGTTPCAFSTTTTYKANGAPATTGLPAAADLPAETLTYAYNDIGEQTHLFSAAQTYVYSVAYNKIGQLTQRQMGAFGNRTVATYTFDEPTRRLVNANVVPELKAEAADRSYSFDDAGLLTGISDTPAGQTPDHQCFRYDGLQRLTTAWTPSSGECGPDPTLAGLGGPAKYWHSWTFDASGGRARQVVHATGGDVTSDYTRPAPGPAAVRPHAVTSVTSTGPGAPPTRSYGYDAAGNTTARPSDAGVAQSLNWNAEGQLATVTEGSKVTRFTYDADGNRLLRKDAAGNTLYLPGGTEVFLPAGATSAGAAKATRYYTHRDETIAVRTAGSLHWLVADHHGTAEQAVANSGLTVASRRTTPYGTRRGGATGTWPAAMDKGFVGGTADPTGLVHLGAREYDPALGQFISVDPVIDPDDPAQLQGYSYSNNDPTTLSDPTGEWPGWLDKAASAVASGVSTAANTVADVAVSTVQSIREDPLKFATGLAVGIAATVAVAAVCSTGVGCVILAGAVAGAAAAGAEYGVDVAQGDREFSVGDLAKEMAIGGAVGGLTAGAGALGGRLLGAMRGPARNAANHADDIAKNADDMLKPPNRPADVADDLAKDPLDLKKPGLGPVNPVPGTTGGLWHRLTSAIKDPLRRFLNQPAVKNARAADAGAKIESAGTNLTAPIAPGVSPITRVTGPAKAASYTIGFIKWWRYFSRYE